MLPDDLEASGRALMDALSVVRRAYAEAYRPLYACVYRFAAAQFRGDLAAADEVATETLGRGWLHITSFRKEDRPRGRVSPRLAFASPRDAATCSDRSRAQQPKEASNESSPKEPSRQEHQPSDPAPPAGNLRGWLLTIARRVCVDVARQRGKNAPLSEELVAGPEGAQRPSNNRADARSNDTHDAPLDPEQLLRRLQELLNQLQPVVQGLADSLPAFQGGRGRPTRGQRLSVALRDLGVGCEKTLEAFAARN